MFKKQYLFLIVFICLFAISAVSAEKIDNSTNDLVVSNEIDNNYEKLSLNQNEDTLEKQVPYEVGKIKFWNNDTQNYEFEQNSPYVLFSQEGVHNEIFCLKIIGDYKDNDEQKTSAILRIMELDTDNVVKSLTIPELQLNQISKMNVNDLNLGNYKLELIGKSTSYSKDGTFTADLYCLAKGIFFVSTNFHIDAPNVNKYYGGSERFIATLIENNGNPISNTEVKISINGNTYTKTTDKNGQVSMALNLNSGKYDVKTKCDDIEVKSKKL